MGKIVKEIHEYEIPNYKHQITNKSQIPILNDQNRFGILNFGHCDLFEICDLLFGVFGEPNDQSEKTSYSVSLHRQLMSQSNG